MPTPASRLSGLFKPETFVSYAATSSNPWRSTSSSSRPVNSNVFLQHSCSFPGRGFGPGFNLFFTRLFLYALYAPLNAFETVSGVRPRNRYSGKIARTFSSLTNQTSRSGPMSPTRSPRTNPTPKIECSTQANSGIFAKSPRNKLPKPLVSPTAFASIQVPRCSFSGRWQWQLPPPQCIASA